MREQSPGLAGLPFNNPEWDYSDQYHEIQAKNALEALERGDTRTVRRILNEMVEIAAGYRRGKRSLIVVGAGRVLRGLGRRTGKKKGGRP